MQINVEKCAACGQRHMHVELVLEGERERFMCNGRWVDVNRIGASEMQQAVTPQPPPRAGEARPTMHLVVEDLLAKGDAGALKYGTQHQADNGRDHLVDAYQECLDQACYLRAEVEKRARWKNEPETLEVEALTAQLAEAQHEVEAARKLGAENTAAIASNPSARTYKRRCDKGLDIVASLGQGAEAPAMRELYEWLSGKRDA